MFQDFLDEIMFTLRENKKIVLLSFLWFITFSSTFGYFYYNYTSNKSIIEPEIIEENQIPLNKQTNDNVNVPKNTEINDNLITDNKILWWDLNNNLDKSDINTWDNPLKIWDKPINNPNNNSKDPNNSNLPNITKDNIPPEFTSEDIPENIKDTLDPDQVVDMLKDDTEIKETWIISNLIKNWLKPDDSNIINDAIIDSWTVVDDTVVIDETLTDSWTVVDDTVIIDETLTDTRTIIDDTVIINETLTDSWTVVDDTVIIDETLTDSWTIVDDTVIIDETLTDTWIIVDDTVIIDQIIVDDWIITPEDFDAYFDNDVYYNIWWWILKKIKMLVSSEESPIYPIPQLCPDNYSEFWRYSNIISLATISLPKIDSLNTMELINEYIPLFEWTTYYYKVFKVNWIKNWAVVYKTNNPDLSYYWVFTICIED